MDSIRTATNILESADNPRVTYGGQSSSASLNKISENMRADLLALDSDVSDVGLELARNRALVSCQASAIGTALTGLRGDLAYIRANLTGKVRVDLFDGRYIDTEANTAAIDSTFGQATLEISSQSDWLVSQDMEGNVWIPTSTKVRYSCNNDGHTPNLNGGAGVTVDEFIEDDQAAYALDGDPGTMWAQEKTNSHIWLDIQVPTDVITNNLANTLILRPFPVFCHDLVSIDIIGQSGNIMTLDADDLKYLPGYTTTESPHVIKSIADTRIFFPPTQVSRIRVHLKAGAFQYWGFSEISLKTTNFKSASQLVFDLNPINNSRFVNSPKLTLRGDDETSLAKLVPTISAFKATYNLSQQASGYTPVITATDVEWN